MYLTNFQVTPADPAGPPELRTAAAPVLFGGAPHPPRGDRRVRGAGRYALASFDLHPAAAAARRLRG